MSGDEALVLFLSLGVAAVGWGARLTRVFAVSAMYSRRRTRLPLLIGPLLAAACIWIVLRELASFDVRDDPTYQLFYLALGGAWTVVFTGSWLGVRARDDVAERGNRAALVAWNGAVIGCAACYAGANVGDGPGWWCVVWAGLLATLGWTLCWMALHALTRIVDHVTIDRDLATGIRAASFLVASGVLWGRGAAGDWTSAYATLIELRAAWPVALVLAKAIVVERALGLTPVRTQGHWLWHGVTPALADVALVALGLELAGALPDGYAIPGGP